MTATSRPLMAGDPGYPYYVRENGSTITRPKPDSVRQEECLWLLQHVRECNPTIKFARHKDYHSIGAWSEPLGRYQVVVGHTLDNHWIEIRQELLVNGKLVHEPQDWIE